MKKHIFVLCLATSLMPGLLFGTGVPVIDGANLGQNLQQYIVQYKNVMNTYTSMQNMITQVQRFGKVGDLKQMLGKFGKNMLSSLTDVGETRTRDAFIPWFDKMLPTKFLDNPGLLAFNSKVSKLVELERKSIFKGATSFDALLGVDRDRAHSLNKKILSGMVDQLSLDYIDQNKEIRNLREEFATKMNGMGGLRPEEFQAQIAAEQAKYQMLAEERRLALETNRELIEVQRRTIEAEDRRAAAQVRIQSLGI